MIECIAEVAVLKVVLMSEIFEELAARFSLISVFIYGKIDGLPDKQVVEHFPALMLDFITKELR